MSDAPVRARASAIRRPKTQAVRHSRDEARLLAEFEAMMERSGQKLEKLNTNLDQMLSRLDSPRLRS